MDTLRYRVVNTSWYQRFIHGFYPLQKYQHEEDLLYMLALVLGLLHSVNFGWTFGVFPSSDDYHQGWRREGKERETNGLTTNPRYTNGILISWYLIMEHGLIHIQDK